MRIISGIHKGRKLIAPKKLPVRPTTDIAKEALFNILNNSYYFDAISVLDLFSGTGNISFEFASRGTTAITAVDSNFGCIHYINRTALLLDIEIQTIKSDVLLYLQNSKKKHTIIFADPPYHMPLEDFKTMQQLVFSNQLLEDDGLLIIEHSKHTDLSALDGFSYTRQYGGSCFSFYKA